MTKDKKINVNKIPKVTNGGSGRNSSFTNYRINITLPTGTKEFFYLGRKLPP